MTVNGWQILALLPRREPRRYRFRVVNARNARFLQMQLLREVNGNQPSATAGLTTWQIGLTAVYSMRPLAWTTQPTPRRRIFS